MCRLARNRADLGGASPCSQLFTAGEQEGPERLHDRKIANNIVDEVIDDQQFTLTLRGHVAKDEAGKIIGVDAEAFLADYVDHSRGQDRALVLGDADRAVKWRRPVPIKPHERVHAVGVVGNEAPTRPEHAPHFLGEAARIREMVDEAAVQHAVEAAALERQILRVADAQIKHGIFDAPERDELGANVEADN